jgi:phosphoribosylaminoimidazolecarboxamide formyltransferase/IMP cyclohydrolase
MAKNDLTAKYKTIGDDPFPSTMQLSFSDGSEKQTLVFEKVEWTIGSEKRGLRYGENPGQPAALYRLVNGNLTLGQVSNISPGRHLASELELLQSGKHPGKINITDADNALNILRYFHETPCCVIVKHNNPCGVAKGATLSEAYSKALLADRIAAFGGAVALNRAVDRETAELISQSYSEVVVAPEYEESTLEVLSSRKNLRIMKIENIKRLNTFESERFLDLKSLIDGGMIVQWSYVPEAKTAQDVALAACSYQGREYRVNRKPTLREYEDLLFGWLVESGITSNSVIYVKDGVTVGIGTGEQDRVGVAEIARDKAYKKTAEKLAWQLHHVPFNQLEKEQKEAVLSETQEIRGGLLESAMISDAFFPFRDGIDVGLREGVSAVIQPGGSLRDFESIEACNEYNATMVFTGQRSFKH